VYRHVHGAQVAADFALGYRASQRDLPREPLLQRPHHLPLRPVADHQKVVAGILGQAGEGAGEHVQAVPSLQAAHEADYESVGREVDTGTDGLEELYLHSVGYDRDLLFRDTPFDQGPRQLVAHRHDQRRLGERGLLERVGRLLERLLAVLLALPSQWRVDLEDMRDTQGSGDGASGRGEGAVSLVEQIRLKPWQVRGQALLHRHVVPHVPQRSAELGRNVGLQRVR
jgi:hypothetical protein